MKKIFAPFFLSFLCLCFSTYGVEQQPWPGAPGMPQQAGTGLLTSRPTPQQLDAWLSTLDAQQKMPALEQLMMEWTQLAAAVQNSGDQAMIDYLYYIGLVIQKHAGGMMPNTGMPNGGMPNGGMPNGGMPNTGMPNGGMPNGGMPNAGMPNGGMPNRDMQNGGIPTPQQFDATLAAASEEERNNLIEAFWNSVVYYELGLHIPGRTRARAWAQKQRLVALTPVIRKYDPMFQQHYIKADNEIRSMLQKYSGRNPDGTVKDRGECTACHRSGKCDRCGGERKYLIGTTWHRCDWCADGRCRFCHGTGFRVNEYGRPYIPFVRPR